MNPRHNNLLLSAASLGLVAAVGTLLLAGVHRATEARIADQERRVMLEQLGQLISPERYDNALHADLYTFRDEQYFPGGQTVTAFRARKRGRAEAVVLKFAAVNGYNGAIHLLVGINRDGTISGVRVSGHKETPGLGDAIEIEKSDWISAFDGRSLSNPVPDRWTVRSAGGAFDQFTGATITPRAVVEGVRKSLEYFQTSREILFGTPSRQPEAEEK